VLGHLILSENNKKMLRGRHGYVLVAGKIPTGDTKKKPEAWFLNQESLTTNLEVM